MSKQQDDCNCNDYHEQDKTAAGIRGVLGFGTFWTNSAKAMALLSGNPCSLSPIDAGAAACPNIPALLLSMGNLFAANIAGGHGLFAGQSMRRPYGGQIILRSLGHGV